MSKFRSIRDKHSKSSSSDDACKVDDTFEQPRTSSFRRLRNTLAKLSPSASSTSSEKELLKKYYPGKVPLTERNVDSFVLDQQLRDAGHSDDHNTEVQVSAWLEKVY